MTESNGDNPSLHFPRGAGDLLTLAFGTTVAMWAVGYVGWAAGAPQPLTVIGMLSCLSIGAILTGRTTARGWRGGAIMGLLVATLNLLILGSLVQNETTPDAPPPSIWLPSTLFATCFLSALFSQAASRKPQDASPNWTARFSLVVLAATLLLLLAGGLVTSREAGLAVPDWPNSYGYKMFLYPLSKMKGNIYYEHAHRLLGALVGLTTIAFALHVGWTDRRRWMVVVVVIAVLAVIGQGIMGGLRVTEADGTGAQVATTANESQASGTLRLAHGIAAQLFFAFLAAIAAMVSTAWKTGSRRERTPWMDLILVALLLLQLCLGAWLRHRSTAAMDSALMLHITVAAMILLLGLGCAMRALAQCTAPPLRQMAVALLALLLLQPTLGVVALLVRSKRDELPTAPDIAFTTAHQLTGALLLATAVALAVLMFRTPEPEKSHATSR